MKINLLPPDEIIPVSPVSIIIRKCVFAAIGIAVIIAAGTIYFELMKKFKNDRFVILENTYKRYTKISNETKKIDSDVESLEKELALIRTTLYSDFYWSEKLLLLSEMMPQEVWLDKFEIKTGRDIRIKGNLIPPEGTKRPIEVLSSFLKTLKNNKQFIKDFTDVSLVDVRTAVLKGREIYQFNILVRGKNK